MKTKEKIKCVIMSVITLFFTLNPAMADSFVVDGITYSTLNYNDYVKIIRVPNQEDVIIPDNVFCEAKKYIVYEVESNAFDNCTKLVSLTLPPTLRYFFAHLDNCTNLVRININSMYDFMELSGDFFTNSDVGLYLNGKLVERVDIINEEPKQSLRGYQKLRSVTFCNPHMTELNSGMLMDCSNIDTLCFKSPIMRSSNSLIFVPVKNIYFYGEMDMGESQYKAKFAYIDSYFKTAWENTPGKLSANVCVFNNKGRCPKITADTCVITPTCRFDGGTIGDCKNIIYLSPTVRISRPDINTTYYVLDKDSATAKWSDYDKKRYMNNIKPIYSTEMPTVKSFEYSGASPFLSIAISDSTDIVKTTWDVDRLRKDVGVYDEMPISFDVHGMKYDISLPYKYSITKAPLTILADNAKREYGKNNPELSCTYMGFKNGETEEDLVTKPTIYTTASAESPVGAYPIIPINAQSLNYSINYKEGALTVVPASQTITWNQDLTKAKVGDIIELTATSSANLKVKFISNNASIADVYTSNGKTYMECLAVGTARITASQPGDSNHSEADDIVKRITVEGINTAVSGIEADANKITGYYTIDGRKVDKLAKGIYIAKYADGRMRKVIVK